MRYFPALIAYCWLTTFLLFLSGCTPEMAMSLSQQSRQTAMTMQQPLNRGLYGALSVLLEGMAQQQAQQRALQTQQAQLVRQQAWEAEVSRARKEFRTVLMSDRQNLSGWINALEKLLSSYKQYPDSPALNLLYNDGTTLLRRARVFDDTANYYLVNLPAHINVNMNVRSIQFEVNEYVSAAQTLNKDLYDFSAIVNEVHRYIKEETKKQAEKGISF